MKKDTSLEYAIMAMAVIATMFLPSIIWYVCKVLGITI